MDSLKGLTEVCSEIPMTCKSFSKLAIFSGLSINLHPYLAFINAVVFMFYMVDSLFKRKYRIFVNSVSLYLLTFVTFFVFSKSISNTSKDKPSPSVKSANPPRSAIDNSLTNLGAFITLKFSIFNFEFEILESMIDEYNSFPPVNPLKKLY